MERTGSLDKGSRAPSEPGEPFSSRAPFHTRSGQVHTTALPGEATKILHCTERFCPRLVTGSLSAVTGDCISATGGWREEELVL